MDETPRWLRIARALNACDIDRLKILAPVGDAIAGLWRLFTRGTECPCCLGSRLLLALAIAGGFGALLAR